MSVQFAGAMHAVLLFLSQSLARLRPTAGRTEVRPYIRTSKLDRLIVSTCWGGRWRPCSQAKIGPVVIIVRLPGNFRCDVKIFRWWRRIRLPLEAGGRPG